MLTQVLLESPLADVPSWGELIRVYGPWLGLILFLVLSILGIQSFWYQKNLKKCEQEIDRLVEHNKELSDRFIQLIDRNLGPKP